MAVCVAVIGKDNGPLLFKCRRRSEVAEANLDHPQGGPELSNLQYSYMVSSSLDIIEERVQPGALGYKASSSGGDGASATRELYLGVLTAQEDYKIYGYMTNTKIKFIIVVEETSVPLRENDIRMMFRKLHAAFCDQMSNPFYIPGTEIQSKRFEAVVASILIGQ